jgi:hypothetical protein
MGRRFPGARSPPVKASSKAWPPSPPTKGWSTTRPTTTPHSPSAMTARPASASFIVPASGPSSRCCMRLAHPSSRRVAEQGDHRQLAQNSAGGGAGKVVIRSLAGSIMIMPRPRGRWRCLNHGEWPPKNRNTSTRIDLTRKTGGVQSALAWEAPCWEAPFWFGGASRSITSCMTRFDHRDVDCPVLPRTIKILTGYASPEPVRRTSMNSSRWIKALIISAVLTSTYCLFNPGVPAAAPDDDYEMGGPFCRECYKHQGDCTPTCPPC